MQLTDQELFKGADFKVGLEPMYKGIIGTTNFESAFEDKKFFTVRLDTQEPIGIVTDRYQLVQHKDNIKIAYNAIKELSDNFAIRNVVSGGKVFTRFMINTNAVIPHSINEETAKIVDDLYSSIITAGTHLAPSIKVAEAAKVIENTQRDLNIAIVNELLLN